MEGLFKYWGSGEWFFCIWVIGYFITFVTFIFTAGKRIPECWMLASFLIMFIWPIVWFIFLIQFSKTEEVNE